MRATTQILKCLSGLAAVLACSVCPGAGPEEKVQIRMTLDGASPAVFKTLPGVPLRIPVYLEVDPAAGHDVKVYGLNIVGELHPPATGIDPQLWTHGEEVWLGVLGGMRKENKLTNFALLDRARFIDEANPSDPARLFPKDHVLWSLLQVDPFVGNNGATFTDSSTVKPVFDLLLPVPGNALSGQPTPLSLPFKFIHQSRGRGVQSGVSDEFGNAVVGPTGGAELDECVIEVVSSQSDSAYPYCHDFKDYGDTSGSAFWETPLGWEKTTVNYPPYPGDPIGKVVPGSGLEMRMLSNLSDEPYVEQELKYGLWDVEPPSLYPAPMPNQDSDVLIMFRDLTVRSGKFDDVTDQSADPLTGNDVPPIIRLRNRNQKAIPPLLDQNYTHYDIFQEPGLLAAEHGSYDLAPTLGGKTYRTLVRTNQKLDNRKVFESGLVPAIDCLQHFTTTPQFSFIQLQGICADIVNVTGWTSTIVIDQNLANTVDDPTDNQGIIRDWYAKDWSVGTGYSMESGWTPGEGLWLATSDRFDLPNLEFGRGSWELGTVPGLDAEAHEIDDAFELEPGYWYRLEMDFKFQGHCQQQAPIVKSLVYCKDTNSQFDMISEHIITDETLPVNDVLQWEGWFVPPPTFVPASSPHTKANLSFWMYDHGLHGDVCSSQTKKVFLRRISVKKYAIPQNLQTQLAYPSQGW